MPTRRQFICICGEAENVIEVGKNTPPCPHCGRTYLGRVSRRRYGVDAHEHKKKGR